MYTAVEGREVALSRDARGNPEGAAHAVVVDCLKRPAAVRARGRGRARHHEGRAHVEGREGRRARALHLGFNHVMAHHHHHNHQHHTITT